MAKRELFTIGYEKAKPQAVLDELKRAKVKLLVDTRAVAASRRPGFSKRQLAASLDEVGIVWAAMATGPVLMLALALVMVSIYGQVTVNDMVIARYTADAWRGRVYAVRYFLLFLSAGAAVAMIARFHQQGGFSLVLMVTAAVTAVFLVAAVGVAIIASIAQPGRQPQPAE